MAFVQRLDPDATMIPTLIDAGPGMAGQFAEGMLRRIAEAPGAERTPADRETTDKLVARADAASDDPNALHRELRLLLLAATPTAKLHFLLNAVVADYSQRVVGAQITALCEQIFEAVFLAEKA